MTLFSSQSQIVILSRLDRIIWSANSPIGLFLDPAKASKFLEGAMVSHLRSHENKNQAIVISPTGDDGVVYSLAEAFEAFFSELKAKKLKATKVSKWPELWQQELAEDKDFHRLLIIENFEQVLDADEKEQEKFWALVRYFAEEDNASVLLMTDHSHADDLAKLEGFKGLEAMGTPIREMPSEEPLPDLKAYQTSMFPMVARAGSLIASLVIALFLMYFYPMESGLVETAFAGSKDSSRSQFVPVLPAPQEIELAGNIDLQLGSDHRELDQQMTQFFEIEVSLVGNGYQTQVAETLKDSVSAPILPPVDLDRYPALLADKVEDRDLVSDGSKPKSTAVGEKKMPAPPVSAQEFLTTFKEVGDRSLAGLDKALLVVGEKFSGRESDAVANWVAQLKAKPNSFELDVAKAFADYEDTEETFAWYQIYAERTSSSEALFHVGAAQLFGRGTEADFNSATDNLLLAWRGGNGDAAYLYGVSQLLGLGVSKDEFKAYYTFNTAMNLGSTLPYREAARMQELGLGERQNLYWACHLYELGANQGDSYCLKRLAEIYEKGENGLFDVDPERAEAIRAKIGQLQQDPMLHLVKEMMPEEFYTEEVTRK